MSMFKCKHKIISLICSLSVLSGMFCGIPINAQISTSIRDKIKVPQEIFIINEDESILEPGLNNSIAPLSYGNFYAGGMISESKGISILNINYTFNKDDLPNDVELILPIYED